MVFYEVAFLFLLVAKCLLEVAFRRPSEIEDVTTTLAQVGESWGYVALSGEYVGQSRSSVGPFWSSVGPSCSHLGVKLTYFAKE